MVLKVLGSLGLLALLVLTVIPTGLAFSLPYPAKVAFFVARVVATGVGLVFLWRGRGAIAGVSAAAVVLLSVAELGANAALS